MKTQIKNSLLFCSAILFSAFVSGQRKADDPKHENHYQVKSLDTPEVSIDFSGAHSQQDFTTVKLSITNKTSDYLLFKSAESVFKYPDNKEFNPTSGGAFRGMNVMIHPKESANKPLRVSGGGYNYHADNLSWIPKGFYRVSSEGKVKEAADFQLPANANDFKAGDCFTCTVEDVKKSTKETKAVFKCKYLGNDIGVIDATKAVVKLQNGQEYVNDNRKDKAVMLSPSEEEKITLTFHVPGKVADMQFATMHIVWKNSFTETKAVPVKIDEVVNFEFDPGMTDGKNK